MTVAANFRHGDPIMVDYTNASTNIAGGDMVLQGSVTANTAGTGAFLTICHDPIANGVTGALAVGGGVYDCMVASNYAAYSKVYKPAGNSILTTTSTNNALFGYTVQTSAAANAVVKVLHSPNAGTV